LEICRWLSPSKQWSSTILALAHASWAQPADPGFAQDPDRGNAQRLSGRWINHFLFARGEETPRRFWQVVDFSRDGQINHLIQLVDVDCLV
jgi:hypothetical protein